VSRHENDAAMNVGDFTADIEQFREQIAIAHKRFVDARDMLHRRGYGSLERVMSRLDNDALLPDDAFVEARQRALVSVDTECRVEEFDKLEAMSSINYFARDVFGDRLTRFPDLQAFKSGARDDDTNAPPHDIAQRWIAKLKTAVAAFHDQQERRNNDARRRWAHVDAELTRIGYRAFVAADRHGDSLWQLTGHSHLRLRASADHAWRIRSIVAYIRGLAPWQRVVQPPLYRLATLVRALHRSGRRFKPRRGARIGAVDLFLHAAPAPCASDPFQHLS
jgi:hypothetical protein